MQCTNCGSEVPDTAKVCGHCGHRLKSVPPQFAHPSPGAPARTPGCGIWATIGVLVALLLIAGVFLIVNPGLLHVFEPTLTPAPTPTPTQIPTATPIPPTPTPAPVTITIQNLDCRKLVLFLDGGQVTTVEKEATTTIQTVAGQHRYNSCLSTETGYTEDCTEEMQADWNTSATITLNRIPECPVDGKVTITLVNNHCYDQDFYVDGVKAVTVNANSTISFIAAAGAHRNYTCNPGTRDCGRPEDDYWPLSQNIEIKRASYCP